ncbi:O-antigen ligase family protein [Pseudonocardia lacus]|uniref:O-antigen ligase family protein n=1 Tax=Pseudonocardia lacus TaxID=2835865 RepID=UPI002027EEB5|nr:O-antigen ligase family protein [Pseudonocardia lacus]
MSTATGLATRVRHAVGLSSVAVVDPGQPKRTSPDIHLLRFATCAVVGLAPVEGYLIDVQEDLAKLPTVVFAVAWLIVRVRVKAIGRLHASQVALAGLAAVVLASYAVHLEEPFAGEYVQRWLPFLVLSALLVDVIGREVPIRAVLASAVAGATWAAIGALQSVLVDGETRASGPLDDPNDLAAVLVTALPLLLALIPPPRPGRRIHPMAIVALVVAAVLAVGAATTLSRGAGFALAAAVAYLAVRRAVPVRVMVGAGVLVAVGAALLVVVAPDTVDRAIGEKVHIAGENIDTRELRWQAAARMLAENPVLGVGPGGFRSEYAAASGVAELAEQTPVAHSMYLEVAAEFGVPGLLLFLAFIACGFIASERALRIGADRQVVLASQAALVAVLVASIFLSEQYYLSMWALVAAMCGLELRMRRDGR